MNIAYFTRFYPNLGGVESFTAGISQALADEGHSVLIVTTDGKPGCTKWQESIEVVSLKSLAFLNGRLPLPLPDKQTHQLKKVLLLHEIDAVAINCRYYPLSLLAAKISARLRLKAILLDHSSNYISTDSSTIGSMMRCAERFQTKLFRKYPIEYYGVSKESSTWLAKLDIVSSGEINNAIDAKSFKNAASKRSFISHNAASSNSNALNIVFAGRILKEKGIFNLVEAASTMESTVTLYIAGDGPDSKQLQGCIRDKGNIHFLGRLDHPDLAALLIQADVFCFPSTYPEGMPTCLLEAGACGCALVTTQNGGTDELIPNPEFGIILDSGEVPAILSALNELASDRNKLHAYQGAIEARIEALFSWKASANKLINALTSD